MRVVLPDPGGLSLRARQQRLKPFILTCLINRYSPTKTETASEGGLDPTAEEIRVVYRRYHDEEAVNGLRYHSVSFR